MPRAKGRTAARAEPAPAVEPITNASRRVWVGRPYPLGATYDGSGTNFSLFSSVAEGVELCLLAAEAPTTARHRVDEERIALTRGRRLLLARLPPRRPPRPALRLPGARAVGPGQRAAVQPGQAAARPVRQGHRRRGRLGRGVLRLRLRRPDSLRTPPTARRTCRAAWSATRSSTGATTAPPQHAMHETIIYEAHVRGLTDAPPGRARPSCAAPTPASPIRPSSTTSPRLGVTAIELMPVHQFVHDHHLVERGLRNYWGYNSIAFLAPHNGYASRSRPTRCRSSRRW